MANSAARRVRHSRQPGSAQDFLQQAASACDAPHDFRLLRDIVEEEHKVPMAEVRVPQRAAPFAGMGSLHVEKTTAFAPNEMLKGP
jgi:hypothetical protein